METKICTKCKEEKDFNSFLFKKVINGYNSICRKCTTKHSLEYKKIRYKTDEKYRKLAIDSSLKRNKKKSKERIKEDNKKQFLYRKENLTDTYVLLTFINTIPYKKFKNIPQELIEAKRQNIILKRKLKNHEQP